MNGIYYFIKLLCEFFSAFYDLCTVGYELCIINAQHIPVVRSEIDFLQDIISLGDHLVVIIKVIEIDLIQLAKFKIYKFSSFRR